MYRAICVHDVKPRQARDARKSVSMQTQHFPEVVAEIREAIQSLGGHVVPKLNWSCPKVFIRGYGFSH